MALLTPTHLADAAQVAESGSPVLLSAVGRAFGLGPAERDALGAVGKGSLPAWFWVTVGLLAGFVAGARVHKKWPDKVPELVKGK
jgi:hypothetical protein